MVLPVTRVSVAPRDVAVLNAVSNSVLFKDFTDGFLTAANFSSKSPL